MPKNYTQPTSEWSYLVNIEDIGDEPKIVKFTASERQRIDLARRLGVVSVEEANATVTLQHAGGGMIHAMGSLQASLTQSCVVTLAPVPDIIQEEFEGWFGDKASAVSFARAKSEREAKKAHVEAELLEESVDPEPIIGGKIDIGELATQYLSLSINPYPRAEGAPERHEFGPKQGEGASIRKSPFEALKDWKEKR